jgi:hypothetical protein
MGKTLVPERLDGQLVCFGPSRELPFLFDQNIL